MRIAFLLMLAAVSAAQDLHERLAAACDLPRPGERLEAARTLASDDSVSLEQWLEACRTLPPRPGGRGEAVPGRRIEEVSLYADGDFETTPVAVFVPESYDGTKPAPLLVVLHWTGGTGPQAIRMWEQIANEQGMLVIAPSETGENAGYGFTQRERDVTLSALRWAKREFRVDPAAVFVTGVSRGGHLAWEMALRHPDLWAGVSPMIGGPYWDVRNGRANMRYLENVRSIPLVDLQGAQDQAGLVWNVRYAFEKLSELGAEQATYHEFPDRGHSYDMSVVDWPAFFESRREARPEKVVRAFARPSEARSFWVEVVEATKDVEEEFEPVIKASLNAKLDEDGRRRWLINETAKRTGRVEARFTGVDRIELDLEEVQSVRLYLEADMFEKKLVVKVGSRRKKPKVELSKEVLLTDFVERLDPTFLPVASVVVKK